MNVEGELVYIASPFTHPDKAVEEKRYELVSRLCIDLMNQGIQVFSPIAYGLPLAKFGDLPTDWGYWHTACKVYLSRCQRMIVVMFDGWKESKGVQGEIEYATSIGIEIEYLNPNAKYVYSIYSPASGEYYIVACTLSYWNAHKSLDDYEAEVDSKWQDMNKSAKLKGVDNCDYAFNYHVDSFSDNPLINEDGDPAEFQSRFMPDPDWTTLPEFDTYCLTFSC